MSQTQNPDVGQGTAALSQTSAAQAHEAQQAARAELATIQATPELRDRYLAGEPTMRATMERLHRAAYPSQSGSGTQGEALQAQPAPGAAPAPENAQASPAGAPEGIPVTAYDLPFPAEAGLSDVKAVKQAQDVGNVLSAVGLEPAIGNAIFARGVELWRQTGGKAADEASLALSTAQAKAELIRQHGERATEILSRARAVVADAVKQDPRVAQWLEMTGLGNDPWTIATLANTRTKKGK